MRRLVALALLVRLTGAAFADERDGGHAPAWYGAWTLIVAGGAAALTGAALTTRPNDDAAGVQLPGLSGPAIAGWTLVALGTAIWIGGAVWLHFIDRPRPRPLPRRLAGFDWRSGALRF